MHFPTKKTGDLGENIACGYLEKNGYKIVSRNLSSPFGEIDIIAKSPDKIYVIIEVKSANVADISGKAIRQSYPHELSNKIDIPHDTTRITAFPPEFHLHAVKIRKLLKLANWYINAFAIDEVRIDGICVDLFKDGSHQLRHYMNIGYL